MPKIPTRDELLLEEAKGFVTQYHQFKEWLGKLSKPARDYFESFFKKPDPRKELLACEIKDVRRWGLFCWDTLEGDLPGKYLDKLETLQGVAEQTTKLDKVRHVKSAGQDRDHHCHWPGCKAQVPPARWGCYKHWMMLPKHFRDALWEAYRIGQEVKRNPSKSYVKVARDVQNWIKENHDVGVKG